jgi:lactate dehydrogenase-like 2-hydroxyacid dehydrogenase
VDHPWLAANGCYLSNTPNAVTEATADMGILLMLSALRGLSEYEANARAGKWREGMQLTDDPFQKTIGFIGMGGSWSLPREGKRWNGMERDGMLIRVGAIGKSMARKTKPWEMKVIYHNRKPLPAAGAWLRGFVVSTPTPQRACVFVMKLPVAYL